MTPAPKKPAADAPLDELLAYIWQREAQTIRAEWLGLAFLKPQPPAPTGR